MFHLCYTNRDAWSISKTTGVYGNVFGSLDDDGNITAPDTENGKWGKLGDLVALKDGDLVFFYVKKSQDLLGHLFGVFRVVGEPYFSQDDHFGSGSQKYPYRFNFTEHKNFPKHVPSSELAKLIEEGKIISMSTFERDRNAPFRGIRQLTFDEGKFLEDLCLRFNPKTDPSATSNLPFPIPAGSSLASTIIESSVPILTPKTVSYDLPVTGVRKFKIKHENALQAHIFYKLRRKLSSVETDIGVTNFSECLMEFPLLKAQQFRADILCLFRNADDVPFFYSIIEIKKKRKISIKDLGQLMGYMKTFAESNRIPFNSLEGVYISDEFEQDTIDYIKSRETVEGGEPIRLVKYSVTSTGSLTFVQVFP